MQQSNATTISPEEKVKEPNVAGQFYPQSAEKLKSTINSFLEAAKPPEDKGTIAAILCPHAGYIYSGPVAAYAYKLLKNRSIPTVIIIGPSHYVDFEGFAVYAKGAFKTPLGTVSVDTETATKLIKSSSIIKSDEIPFRQEHSVEVQIPFLQVILKNFKIVPVVAGRADLDSCKSLAGALSKVFKPGKTLIVASSDMSHYHPSDAAEKMDRKTISYIERMDTKHLYEKLNIGECELCGAIPVLATLSFIKDLSGHPVFLKYAHSGAKTGDNSRVVGYTAVAFYIKNEVKEDAELENEAFLNESEKKLLLRMVRETLEEYLKTGKTPSFFKDSPVPENLKKEAGMFVTLHKFGNLRGCIGYITGREPLYQAVVELAISSATRDPRFRPVKCDELKDIDIEISVMTPLERIDDPCKVIAGKHGVYIKKGFSSGVFLPQVATEQGWDRETFLTELCCHKAGLPPDAWKDKNTELYIFSAEIFGEEK